MIKVLQDRLKDMQDTSDGFPVSVMDASKATKWDKPSTEPVLADRSAVNISFDREEAVVAYKNVMDTPGKDYGSRDAQAAKLQSDLLSTFQQGFVMRNRSRIQLLADAASMRRSVSEDRVPLVMERQIANVEGAR